VAELYPLGIQRIFYKASNDGNLIVTAKIFDPNLGIKNHYTFTKVLGTNQIYFADVDFYTEGIWIAVFYENGEEKAIQAYNTKKILVEGEFKLRDGNKGPNVIG